MEEIVVENWEPIEEQDAIAEHNIEVETDKDEDIPNCMTEALSSGRVSHRFLVGFNWFDQTILFPL